jgi:hypothetical protein
MNDMDKVGILRGMYSSFRKNTAKDTLSILDEYARKKGGRVFQHITVDKVYRVERKGIWESIGLGELFGVYLVSIHRKVRANEYQLIWPPRGKSEYNVDLLRIANIRRLIKLLHPECDDMCVHAFVKEFLYDKSYSLGRDAHLRRIEEINRRSGLSEKEKTRLITVEDNAYLQHLQNDFRLEIDGRLDEIFAIRLSFLVVLLKEIVGGKCAVNVMDYSCHRIFPAIKDKTAGQYLLESDIENPPPYSRMWGGSTFKKSTFKKSTFRKGGAKSTFKKGGAKSTFKKGGAKTRYKKKPKK